MCVCKYFIALTTYKFLQNSKYNYIESCTYIPLSIYRENLLLTCGATHGLHLVYSLLLDKGDTIFIEDPTFFTSMQILRVDFRMNLIPGQFKYELIFDM